MNDEEWRFNFTLFYLRKSEMLSGPKMLELTPWPALNELIIMQIIPEKWSGCN